MIHAMPSRMLRRGAMIVLVGVSFWNLSSFRALVSHSNYGGLWSLGESSSSNDTTRRDDACLDTGAGGERLSRTDWFRGKLWRDSCLEVEHVCHSTGRLWYKDKPGANQPNMTFVSHKQHNAKVAYPERILVRPATDAVRNMSCPYSPLPNHLVLFSLYNDMLGEFYLRIMIGLAYILEQEENVEALTRSTQMYLHLYNFDRHLLESHHAFMTPFSSHPLLDFKELLQSTSCSCAERLIFCGYDFEAGGENQTDIVVKSDGGFPVNKYGKGTYRNKYDPEVFRGARDKLRERAILGNPLVRRDMDAYRLEVLLSHGAKEPLEGWKIVGLAQRSGRRRWLDLVQTMDMCREKLFSKRILCIEVNVETPEYHPTHHVVVHGILDGLVGIHGAQLTDAIWMKPGALVVEMLPYLPNGSWGVWTRAVQSPTPLGMIFLGSDLFHVGLPLKADSVPQCTSKYGDEFRDCMKDRRWDNRDFSVNPKDIEDVLSSYMHERPASCEEQNRLAGTYRFVLYSVQCDDGTGTGMVLHNFYWDRTLESMDEYSGIPLAPNATLPNVTLPPGTAQ